jgi:hypothetical protein
MIPKKSPGQKRYERKVRLYKDQNGLCFYCHGSMFLKPRPLYPEKPNHDRHHPDEATIEHLYDRYDLEKRHSPNPNHEVRRVLVCHQCNSQREIERTSAMSKEELWNRSGRKPLNLPPVAQQSEDVGQPNESNS